MKQGQHRSVQGAALCIRAGPVADLPGYKSKIKENASTAPLRVSNLTYGVWAGPSCLFKAYLVHSGSDVTGEGGPGLAGSVMGAGGTTPTARRGGKVLLLGNTTEKGSRIRAAAILQQPGKSPCMEGKSIHSILDLPTRGTTGQGLERDVSNCSSLLQKPLGSLMASQNASPAAQ